MLKFHWVPSVMKRSAVYTEPVFSVSSVTDPTVGVSIPGQEKESTTSVVLSTVTSPTNRQGLYLQEWASGIVTNEDGRSRRARPYRGGLQHPGLNNSGLDNSGLNNSGLDHTRVAHSMDDHVTEHGRRETADRL